MVVVAAVDGKDLVMTVISGNCCRQIIIKKE